MRLTGKDLALASQGKWLKDMPDSVGGIGTDTRDFAVGEAFLALRGPNFDGHNCAHQVSGIASALIGDSQGVNQWETLATPQLKVEDTLRSLGDIASFYRSRLQNTKVIAITGSYGKTTVRSMLKVIFKQLGLNVAATHANLNNLIGVPKTLLSIDMNTDVALIECGISEQGEMQRLSEIVQPDIAIVTGLSHAHGEGLGGLHSIAREKSALMQYLDQDGWVVLGVNVAEHFQQAGCMPKQETIVLDDSVISWQLDGHSLSLSDTIQNVSIDLLLPAKHWAEDMALAALVALKLGQALHKQWSLEAIGEALSAWEPVEGRMAIHRLPSFTLIDDAYNANPASMQSALDTLADTRSYRIAILGDMLELGSDALSLHQALNLHDIDEVLTVGQLMGSLQSKNPNHNFRVFRDSDALAAWITPKDFPPKASTVLIKGSHGTGLYQLVAQLKQRGQHVI